MRSPFRTRASCAARPLALLAALPLLAAFAAVASRSFAADVATQRTNLPIAMSVDRPLGTLSCDRLGLVAGLPADVIEDERLAPNHCLVRLFSFPSQLPLDLPIESIELRGATQARRVGVGEFLFESITLSYTSVTVRDLAAPPDAATSEDEAAAGAALGPAHRVGGRRRPPALASRNPLLLARHATTRCDLWIAETSLGDATVALHGIVLDRTDGAPVEGATIRCGRGAAAATTTTGSDGRYRLPEPVRLTSLLEGTIVEKAGYSPSSIGARQLPSAWVERFQLDGVSAFLLFPADRAKLRSQLLPKL
ncbi:MAG: hypothetical protein JNL90_01745 [Planctomycetes bacterium]|nr:hypothetical protein [Planctomycetota bacterium]